ncbi:MAG: penicillin-binding protein 2 [Planctomycetota bacterium]
MRIIRCAIIVTAILCSFIALAGRCFYLQYFQSGKYQHLSLRQRQVNIKYNPRRAAVVDCRGRLLAASNETYSVFAEPRIVKDVNKTALELHRTINIPSEQIARIIKDSRNRGFVKIKANLKQWEIDTVRRENIVGVGLFSDWTRYYPTGRLMCHVIGFVGAEQHGLAGAEFLYDQTLCGSSGEDIFFVDASRKPIWPREQKAQCSEGMGVILTIDATIQQFARDELYKQFKKYNADSAVVIVMKPKTGEILAMVSLPDFDPCNFSKVEPSKLKNRAICDPFEPGSILKPIVAAIAIDNDILSIEEKIFCEQGDYRGKGFGRIGEYGSHRFGTLSVCEILIKSSNIGMAKIGQRMGKEKLYDGLKLFGFGQKTGVDLPGEDCGILWPTDRWTGYSVTRIPFGQEIAVTAIQIARAFCILANGGKQVRPYVVKAFVDSDGKIHNLKQAPSPAGYVIKPEAAKQIVMQALTGVVERGTGQKARLEKWHVFGKTGTANIARSGEAGYDNYYVSSFIGGAPAEDARIVVLVSIRNPDKSIAYTGGTVAAPVVGSIIEKTLNYLEQMYPAKTF